MEIFFKSTKLQKICNSSALLQKAYGKANGSRIRLRLAVLEAADRLSDVPSTPPERCHLLKGPFAGCFAVDALQPFRIVFCPTEKFVSKKSGASLQLQKITSIIILEVVDYH